MTIDTKELRRLAQAATPGPRLQLRRLTYGAAERSARARKYSDDDEPIKLIVKPGEEK